jgi:2-dehydro-3-deoxyphosphogluconate aldolase/(4S)-4-hydroxy-2-oxoglutarate aldolase
MSAIEPLLGDARVIPVVVIDVLDDAIPIASALAAGGLRAIEVTLRTNCAVDAIGRIAAELDGEVVVGAGTLVAAHQVGPALAAGARFLVSPGSTPTLLEAMQDSGAPCLPGVATASEVISLLERGLTEAKLFPATPLGGTGVLKALAGPFPEMRFCPTGGIDAAGAVGYLALPNVICVGGSWMLPADAIRTRDWGRIEQLAREAAALAAP